MYPRVSLIPPGTVRHSKPLDWSHDNACYFILNLNCFWREFRSVILAFKLPLFHKMCFDRAPAVSKSFQFSLTLCLASQAFLVWMFLWSTKVEPPLEPKWIFLVGNCASSLLSGFWLFVIMTSFILLKQQCPHGILWQAAASFPLRLYIGLLGPLCPTMASRYYNTLLKS